MDETQFDVAIVGAGPVGCALALGLQGSGLAVALVERPRIPAAPGKAAGAVRAIALSYASRLILERLGAWAALTVTPIERIHVSQRGGFGHTRISSADVGLPSLGYVASYDEIARRLAERLDAGLVSRTQSTSAPSARVLVHAEGTPGEHAVERQYGQVAIVALVSTERPAHGVAWERFTGEGPLALLPYGRDYALVWSVVSGAASGALMAAGDDAFLRSLQQAVGLQSLRFTKVGARASMPLLLRYRASRAAPGEVYIGNASQTLHPVAGQGLNLGLRDAWVLARLLRRTPAEMLRSSSVAEAFGRSRRIDVQGTIRATDLLATLFVRRDPVSAILRSFALAAFDVIPPARRALARGMIYGPGAC